MSFRLTCNIVSSSCYARGLFVKHGTLHPKTYWFFRSSAEMNEQYYLLPIQSCVYIYIYIFFYLHRYRFVKTLHICTHVHRALSLDYQSSCNLDFVISGKRLVLQQRLQLLAFSALYGLFGGHSLVVLGSRGSCES